ncbi:hypothetical protein [Streptomyces collinus]|uniref:hypothetical protein n=1 Tax=Streptomyces collinus TaxID=42684 RepID=UPI0033D7F455
MPEDRKPEPRPGFWERLRDALGFGSPEPYVPRCRLCSGVLPSAVLPTSGCPTCGSNDSGP